MLNRAILTRLIHRWLGLFVGVQVVVWLFTGLYMVVVDIDFIHGDGLVSNMQQPLTMPDETMLDVASLRERYPDALRIGLKPLMGKALYTVTTVENRYLIDPANGVVQSPLDEKRARQIAKFHFNGSAAIINAALITANPPQEIQSRRLPLWRLDFDDRFATSFYIDPYTGVLVTRRFTYWRIFDFMWMLHIMDYQERADAHHPLLIGAQIAGLIFVISGLWLLLYSFKNHRSKRAVDSM